MSRSVPWKPEAGIVLAAGLGTRMRPLTDQVPKPLVRLKGRALIDHVLDRLAEAGISRAVVNVHYHADALEAHLRQRKNPRIEISDERGVLLDTGGGVVRALPKLGSGPFLIHNSELSVDRGHRLEPRAAVCGLGQRDDGLSHAACIRRDQPRL